MKAIYESEVEIVMVEVFDKPREEALKRADEFSEMRRGYAKDSQEHAILDRLFDQDLNHTACSGKNGYIGSYHNCAFSVLYEVFGVDVIAFLFSQPWVPHTIIDLFQPKQFLTRLTVLEEAANLLREGDALPALLPETAPYLWPGIVHEPSSFLVGRNGFFLRHSFRELRDFGELGRRMEPDEKKLKVDINIFIPDGEYSPEILAFAAQQEKQVQTSHTHLTQQT
jgi:hypothetical protein